MRMLTFLRCSKSVKYINSSLNAVIDEACMRFCGLHFDTFDMFVEPRMTEQEWID